MNCIVRCALALLVSTRVTVAISHADTLAVPYVGTKVFRVPTGSQDSIQQYDALLHRLDLTTWTERLKANSHIDVQVPSEHVQDFKDSIQFILTSQNISEPILTMHEDLGESIRLESQGAHTLEKRALVDDHWFQSYHSYDDHLSWFDDISSKYPDNTKIISAGKSGEGRNLTALHIFGSSGPDVKPGVVYHSTVHAREWITTMVNEYIAYKLLSDAQSKTYIDSFDFYIFPFSNPDGFVYTQTTERLWRKNRRKAPDGASNECVGVDINRNWPHSSWNQSEGASTNPCSEAYKGTSAGSEPETKAISSWLSDKASSSPGVLMYLDWHSFSQLAMSPYGYACNKTAPDSAEHASLLAGFASSLKAVHGTIFETGPICSTIYPASGTSVDYAYDNAKIKYSFTVELRDTGNNGFVLPPSEILPSAEEVFAGLQYIWKNLTTSDTTPSATNSSSGPQETQRNGASGMRHSTEVWVGVLSLSCIFVWVFL